MITIKNENKLNTLQNLLERRHYSNIGDVCEPQEETKFTETESMKKSQYQVKVFEDALAYLDINRENRSIVNVNNFKEISKLKVENYMFTFSPDNKYVHIKDKNNDYKYGTVSLGNRKLKRNNPNRVFIIWNIQPKITCPNKTKDCEAFCYATKGWLDLRYGNSTSVISRNVNLALSMVSNFDEIMINLVKFVTDNLRIDGKEVLFRWHESGDIYSPKYWGKIRRIIDGTPMTNHMIYTKTVFMIDEMIKGNYGSNATIRYSIDDSTKDYIYKKVMESGILTTRVIEEEETDLVPILNTCLSSCDKCGKCWNKEIQDIFFPKH